MRFESGTSWIQSRSANHITATLDVIAILVALLYDLCGYLAFEYCRQQWITVLFGGIYHVQRDQHIPLCFRKESNFKFMTKTCFNAALNQLGILKTSISQCFWVTNQWNNCSVFEEQYPVCLTVYSTNTNLQIHLLCLNMHIYNQ
jgi:hypothetical protein